MHSSARRFIKTGIAFLLLGVSWGVYLLIRRELWSIWPNPYYISAHVHAVLIGFVMFLILGVALWLFPRADKADTRYDPRYISAAYWMLTASTHLRFITEVLRAFSDDSLLRWAVVISAVVQAAGLALYFWTMWTRIRPVGSHLREAAGEKF